MGSIIAAEHASLVQYRSAKCSPITDTNIGSNGVGHYWCNGRSNILDSRGNITGTVLLEHPAYTHWLVTISFDNCNAWMASLSGAGAHSCYVDNPQSHEAVGYTTLESIYGYFVMLAFLALVYLCIILGGTMQDAMANTVTATKVYRNCCVKHYI